MSFISPSRLSAYAKISFFENHRPRRRQPKANSTIAMASPYKRLHNQGDSSSGSSSTDSTEDASSPRNPLSFLSPNHWHPSSLSTTSLDETSILPSVTPDKADEALGFSGHHLLSPTDVVSLLHQQVLELVPEDDESCQEKLQLLQGKLEKIQVGLRAIDQERRELVDKCQRLELEKSRIEQQLQLREREIGTLSKRCAQQTAQVKEATLIRRTHRDLNSKVQELSEELSKSDLQGCHVVKSVKQLLLECQHERDHLKARLGLIQKDYDKVTDSLQDCLQRIATLTTKQKQWEEEKVMNTRAGNQQRLQHSVVVQRLQRTISSKEDEIQRLHQSAKSLQSNHERNIHDLEGRHGATLSEMQQEHQRRHSELTKELQEHILLCQQRDAQVEQLKSEMTHSADLIVTLETEVASTLEKLMSATSTIQKAEEDSAMFHALTCDIESLQQEQERLSERLHERDTNIAELSAEILKLEMEKHLEADRAATTYTQLELARFEIDRLKEQVEVTGSEPSQRPSDDDEVLRRNLEQYRIEKQELARALDSKELQLRQATGSMEELQRQLQESVSSKAHHETSEIDKLRAAMKEARTRMALQEDEIRDIRVIELSDLEDKLRLARQEVELLSQQLLTARDELKRRNRSSTDDSTRLEHPDVIADLKQTISELTAELERQNVTIRGQERHLKESSADVSILSQQLAVKQQLEDNLRLECRELQSMLDTVQGDCNQLAAELDTKSCHTTSDLAVEAECARMQLEWSEREAVYLNELNEERSRRELAERDAKEAREVHELLELDVASLKAKIQQHGTAARVESTVDQVVLKERSNTRGSSSTGTTAAATVRRTASRLYRAASHRPTLSEPTFAKAAFDNA